MATASRRHCSPHLDPPLPGLPHLALQRYLPASVVDRLARECGVRGYRRVHDPLRTLWGLVASALAGGLSQEAAVERLAAALGRELSAGSGALCRARRRLPTAFVRACAEQVAQRASGFVRAPGASVFYAADGFCVALEHTPANAARYPQSNCQQPQVGWPLLHAVALVDQGTGCIRALELGTLNDHDAKLGRPLWDRLKPGDTGVFDRGFASYGLLVAAERRRWTAVLRQHQRRHNEVPLVGERDDRVEVWARPKDYPDWWDEAQPAQFATRVVRQRLDSGQVWVVNTNASAALLSDEQVLALYQERWRIETRFLELKAYLALEPLRAKDPDTAETLLWGWVLAFNLVRCLLCEAAAKQDCSPYELSFSAALGVLAAALAWPDDDAEAVGNWVLARVGANRLPRRKGGRRDEPRRVKGRHQAYSLLRKPRGEYPEHSRSRAA